MHSFSIFGGLPPSAETDGILTSSFRSLVTGITTPFDSEILDNQARMNILKASLAARIFQIKHKRLPEEWDDLVGEYLSEIPVDPYTEEPLGMVLKNKSLIFYSVGQDRNDNWGTGYFSAQDLTEQEKEDFEDKETDISLSIIPSDPTQK